jgi:hypothetical protein
MLKFIWRDNGWRRMKWEKKSTSLSVYHVKRRTKFLYSRSSQLFYEFPDLKTRSCRVVRTSIISNAYISTVLGFIPASSDPRSLKAADKAVLNKVHEKLGQTGGGGKEQIPTTSKKTKSSLLILAPAPFLFSLSLQWGLTNECRKIHIYNVFNRSTFIKLNIFIIVRIAGTTMAALAAAYTVPHRVSWTQLFANF